MSTATNEFKPLRSVLYMPSSNERALEKAKTLAADAIIFDLEDAVAPDAKPAAREAAAAAAGSGDYGRRTVTIRVNGIGTEWQWSMKDGVLSFRNPMRPATLFLELDQPVTGIGPQLPRSPGWAARHLAALRELGTGIVYCDDGYQHQALPTQWAMTVDIVRELKAMVPAEVEHLYCDNAVMDLGVAAGCLTYLPDVLIEHMNPYARKGTLDAQYQRVNSRAQYARDRPAYAAWRAEHLPGQAAAVRRLRTAQ